MSKIAHGGEIKQTSHKCMDLAVFPGFAGFPMISVRALFGGMCPIMTRERWMGLTKLKLFQNERPQEVLQNMEVSHATMTPTQWALKGVGELPHFKNLRLCMEGLVGFAGLELGELFLKILGFFPTKNHFRVCGQQKGFCKICPDVGQDLEE